MLVTSDEKAKRLARAIISDVSLYNQKKVQEGIMKDNLFELLAEEIEEGRKLYHSKVSPEILQKSNYYDQAIVDVLVKQSKKFESKIW